ncbi:MAG: efflux RND transporter periplasmic adaptor subunit [Deltaproteobacteria bacterium]|nr:efflux RND transporter periplasmic adaptor subunit [Deltaproteobacteria bacterium]
MGSFPQAPSTPFAEPPLAAPWRSGRGIATALTVTALVVIVTFWRHAGSSPEPATPASFIVANDHVDVVADAPTWSYLTLATATLGDSLAPEPVPGRVAFDEARSQPVVAPLPGRVETVAVRLGQRVEQGERLIAVRSSALVDVYKDLRQSQAEEAAREKNVARLRSLFALKAEPEKELISAEEELKQVQLAREAAQLKLRSLAVAETDGNLYWLTASRAGVVVERTVLVGQEIGPDRTDPLMVVADLVEVIVTADVPEEQVGVLQVGQGAQIVSPAAPDHPVEGRVEYIGEVVDPTRRMVDVRIRVPDDDHALRPNAFVEVEFASGSAQRIVVPADAVVNNAQQSFVFVQKPDHAATLGRRPVTLGRQRAGKAEIVTGLRAGETYVSKGAILLLNAIDLARE